MLQATAARDGYVARGSDISRTPGQIFGVPGEDRILRAISAKLNATRRTGVARRERQTHGRRNNW